MLVILYKFTLKIQTIFVIRRHGTVIKTIYWHHTIVCVYGIKIRTVSRRRYVVKHNLITEVHLMNVMENNYMFRPVLAIIRLSMELKG